MKASRFKSAGLSHLGRPALRLVSAAERRERDPKGLGKLPTGTGAGDENVWAASAPLLPAVSSELNQQLHASRRERPRQ